MIRHIKSTAITLLLVLAFSALAVAGNPCNPCNPCNPMKGKKFFINDVKNSVSFKSEAPLEDFIGTSNEITGHIMFDPANPKAGGSGSFTIPVASLNTGIPMRNDHLQGADWLDATGHPNITFKIHNLKKIKETKKKAGSTTYDVVMVGDFTIRGVKKSLEIEGKFTYLEDSKMTKMQGGGNLLIARASFPVKLSDFGVPQGKYKQIVGSKVGEYVDVSVKLIGTDSPKMASNPCNPCNPCNPHKGKNPCNPCNPCGG